MQLLLCCSAASISGGLVMRTTFAAKPRFFDWQSGCNTKTYNAQPFPPIEWEHVPVSTAIKWSEAVHISWVTKETNGENAYGSTGSGALP
jgi:hypothetical protein